MIPTYKILLENADKGETSNAIQFTQGVGTIIISGTLPSGSNGLVMEASYNGTDFAPIDGLDRVNDPIAHTLTLAHGVYVRARIPSGGGGSCDATVVIC